MFERLRSVFTRGATSAADRSTATATQLSQWAKGQGWSFAFQGEPAQFHLGGVAAGQPWRMESGAPARDYIHGTELRARADLRVAPEVALMVISRSLKEELEGRVYGAITDTMQTAVDDSLPQEMRWLAIYEELRWPELPTSFSRLFAVVGAEHVLKLLPKGTHEYQRFIRPSELSRWAREAGLEPLGFKGMEYNPFTQRYWLSADTSVNYLLACRVPG